MDYCLTGLDHGPGAIQLENPAIDRFPLQPNQRHW